VAGIRDQSMSVGYVRNLAGWLGLDPNEVQRAVSTARSALANHSQQDAARPSRDDAQQAAPAPVIDEPSITRLATDTTTRTERDVLMAILQHPELVGQSLMTKAAAVGFGDASLEIVRDAVAVSIAHADSADWIARVSAEVPQRYATLVNQLAVAPIPAREDKLAVYCTSIVSDFIDRDLLREKRSVMGTMQRLDAAAEPERYAEVQRELVRIETERRVLRNE
jgi:DNA primase